MDFFATSSTGLVRMEVSFLGMEWQARTPFLPVQNDVFTNYTGHSESICLDLLPKADKYPTSHLKKGRTPQNCLLCFVITNSIVLIFLYVWIWFLMWRKSWKISTPHHLFSFLLFCCCCMLPSNGHGVVVCFCSFWKQSRLSWWRARGPRLCVSWLGVGIACYRVGALWDFPWYTFLCKPHQSFLIVLSIFKHTKFPLHQLQMNDVFLCAPVCVLSFFFPLLHDIVDTQIAEGPSSTVRLPEMQIKKQGYRDICSPVTCS